MKDELVKYEVAKLAKEKGFNELCNCYITEENTYELIQPKYYNNSEGNLISCPTQSLLQRWLRENHGVHLQVIFGIGRMFHCAIDYMNVRIREYSTISDTYEKALEAGLLQALKDIK
jgi:hypothetical protein